MTANEFLPRDAAYGAGKLAIDRIGKGADAGRGLYKSMRAAGFLSQSTTLVLKNFMLQRNSLFLMMSTCKLEKAQIKRKE